MINIYIKNYRVAGTPPPWGVTGINNFVMGALTRAGREGGPLPDHFLISFCPWGERNACGGTPSQLQEVIDPRFRLIHFTGCGRPYLVIIFIGDDAVAHQQIARRHLPWSEHFAVTCHDNEAVLEYLSSIEDIEGDHDLHQHTLRELLLQSNLIDF